MSLDVLLEAADVLEKQKVGECDTNNRNIEELTNIDNF
jgi:hypothetical protein